MRFFVALIIVLVVAVSGWFVWFREPEPTPATPEIPVLPMPEAPITLPPALPEPSVPRPIGTVPFTSQAPLAEWEERVFQDACEEASLLMAIAWAEGDGRTVIPRDEARRTILEYSDETFRLFGDGTYDTSAEDTAALGRALAPGVPFEARTGITADDIVSALEAGWLVIVPADGQKLGNPNFTRPGPERHMVLVIGYDAVTQEFITNDPGTRLGQGYRYDEDGFFAAIRDYATGDHAPISGVTKSMITVGRAEMTE